MALARLHGCTGMPKPSLFINVISILFLVVLLKYTLHQYLSAVYITFSLKIQCSKMSRIMTKPTKCPVRPAKTQISLGIRPDWSFFTVRVKKAWVLSYPLNAQRRLWSIWADAQADLSLHWAHRSFFWFCHAAAQIILTLLILNEKKYSFWNINQHQRTNWST